MAHRRSLPLPCGLAPVLALALLVGACSPTATPLASPASSEQQSASAPASGALTAGAVIGDALFTEQVPTLEAALAGFTAPTDVFDSVAAQVPAIAPYRDSVAGGAVAILPAVVAAVSAQVPAPAPSPSPAAVIAGATLASARMMHPLANLTDAPAGSGTDYGFLGAVTVLVGQSFNRLASEAAPAVKPLSGSDTTTEGTTTTTVGMTVKLADATGDSEFALSMDSVVAKDAKGGSTTYTQGVGFGYKGRVCPDATGSVVFDATTHVTGTAAGGTSSTEELTAHIVIGVDDNAMIAALNTDVRQGTREHTADGRDIYVEATEAVAWTPGADGRVTGGNVTRDAQLVRQSQQATFSDAGRLSEAGLTNAMKFALGAAAGAEAYWQQGGCIRIDATAPATVAPGATTTIPVAVTHILDTSSVPAKVTVSLKGEQSVSPATIDKAPGSITHVAGADGTSSTITLTAVSRRGKATLTLVVRAGGQAYTASGGGPGITTTGTVASLTAPFTLQGVGGGFTADFVYSPTSPDGRSGTVTYMGAGTGVTMKGDGTYTITGDVGGPLTLTQTTNGCVSIGGCRTNTETITLTPVAAP